MSYFLPSEKEINFSALIIGLFKYERLHKLHSQSTPCGVSCHGSETAKGHKYVSESQTVKFLIRRSYFLRHATNRTHYDTSQFVRLSISLNTHGNDKCFRQILYILFKITFHSSSTLSNNYAFLVLFPLEARNGTISFATSVCLSTRKTRDVERDSMTFGTGDLLISVDKFKFWLKSRNSSICSELQALLRAFGMLMAKYLPK